MLLPAQGTSWWSWSWGLCTGQRDDLCAQRSAARCALAWRGGVASVSRIYVYPPERPRAPKRVRGASLPGLPWTQIVFGTPWCGRHRPRHHARRFLLRHARRLLRHARRLLRFAPFFFSPESCVREVTD